MECVYIYICWLPFIYIITKMYNGCKEQDTAIFLDWIGIFKYWYNTLGLGHNIKEINPEYSLGGLMLKLQYFGHLMGKANWLRKTLMLGKIEGRRRRRQQRMRWLDGITDSMDISFSKLRELMIDREVPGSSPGWSREFEGEIASATI